MGRGDLGCGEGMRCSERHVCNEVWDGLVLITGEIEGSGLEEATGIEQG
jgi:hypothetical protein